MTDALIYEAPAGADIDTIENMLASAFGAIRAALAQQRPVVVIVRDDDLLGHRQPAEAALAGALIGMTRALATEGIRDGWRINAIAVTPEVSAEERTAWVERLAESTAVSGELVRLGTLHLGRVPV